MQRPRLRVRLAGHLTVSCLCLGLVIALGAPRVGVAAPPAESADAAQARALYEKGMARFHLEEYDSAIEMWEAGFRIRPVPELLYNIAQAHRLAKRPDKALGFYQKFLRLNPKAPNVVPVGVVDETITSITRLVFSSITPVITTCPHMRVPR